MHQEVSSVILLWLGVIGSHGQGYGNQYENTRSQSLERYLLDSPYNLCRQPLFGRSNVTATSWWHDRLVDSWGKMHSLLYECYLFQNPSRWLAQQWNSLECQGFRSEPISSAWSWSGNECDNHHHQRQESHQWLRLRVHDPVRDQWQGLLWLQGGGR